MAISEADDNVRRADAAVKARRIIGRNSRSSSSTRTAGAMSNYGQQQQQQQGAAAGWLEQPKHDPIATDTNLAEIDFEDFRNEDLAYAFSCGVSHREGGGIFPSVRWPSRIFPSASTLSQYRRAEQSVAFYP